MGKENHLFLKNFLDFCDKTMYYSSVYTVDKGVYYETNIQKSVYDTDRFLDCPSHRYSAGYAD